MLMFMQHGLLKYYFTALMTLPKSSSGCETHGASKMPLLNARSLTVFQDPSKQNCWTPRPSRSAETNFQEFSRTNVS